MCSLTMRKLTKRSGAKIQVEQQQHCFTFNSVTDKRMNNKQQTMISRNAFNRFCLDLSQLWSYVAASMPKKASRTGSSEKQLGTSYTVRRVARERRRHLSATSKSQVNERRKDMAARIETKNQLNRSRFVHPLQSSVVRTKVPGLTASTKAQISLPDCHELVKF